MPRHVPLVCPVEVGLRVLDPEAGKNTQQEGEEDLYQDDYIQVLVLFKYLLGNF